MALRSLASGVARRRASLQRLAAPQLLAARFYASEGEQKVKADSGALSCPQLPGCRHAV
jgi:hypothetical protein